MPIVGTHEGHARRILVRGVVAFAVAFAAAAPSAAQTLPADPYEPNDSPETATSIEPATRYLGTLAAPGDADWFSIAPDSAAWKPVFDDPAKQIYVAGERLDSGCGEQSLRVTLFQADEILTSSVLYTGSEAVSVMLDKGDRSARYDLRVVTALDPPCTQPIRYFLRPTSYTPAVLGSGTSGINDTATCPFYEKNARTIKHRLKHARTKKLIAKLKRDRKVNTRKLRKYKC
ncbi:MAG: hypothetical protein QOE31_1462 [Solirubrobacteraceae bacterium]|jgi:hypothetical protein|nr:hypothetical protein [Solirubrobacteraceae bacterium]